MLLPIAITLQGCGGSSSNTTLTGAFKNTEGVTYESGNEKGLTNAKGEFTYEEGEKVTFSIGGVTIGTVAGKEAITPLDLVSDASSATTKVKNIVRFLMLLDADAIPNNGIKISISPDITKDWSAVDFNASSFEDELVSIIAAVGNQLPTADVAKAHLEATLRCVYAGAYAGKFMGSNDDNGNFGFLVHASDGNIEGDAYNMPKSAFTTLNGLTPISYNSTVAFISGDLDTGDRFKGNFTSTNKVTGTWDLNSSNGDFLGTRLGGAADALYRFTAKYRGVDRGLFTFDVKADNSVEGIAYSVRETIDMFTFSGTVSGNDLSVTSSDGKTKITGTLDKETGALQGDWDNESENLAGTFTGSGCKLN